MRLGCPHKAFGGICRIGGPGSAAANGAPDTRANLKRFIAAWLKYRRQPLKIVAQQIGVAESTLSQWAHGHRFPKPEELDTLARCARVSVGCLFCPVLADTYEHDARES